MRSLLVPLLGLALAASAPELAEAAGKGKEKTGQAASRDRGDRDRDRDRSTERVIGNVISAVERAIIGNYIREARASGGGLPPGLAKRERLPPGLAKQIRRNGRLPPGLAKRGLPDDLRRRLPRREGQAYRVIGDDIVLIEVATEVILDVIEDALR